MTIPYSPAKWADSGVLRPPTAAELATGFQCGPLDPELFNFLFNDLQNSINNNATCCLSDLNTAGIVPAGGVPKMYIDDTIAPQALNVWDCTAGGYVAYVIDKEAQTNGTNGVPIPNISDVDAWKQPVRAASDGANVALNNLQTLDGVVLADGDRVLLKDQTAQAENGLWIVRAGGAWERTADFDDDVEAPGAVVTVLEGTTNSASVYVQTEPSPAVGTDPILWTAIPTQAQADDRYVNTSGDTMTGNLDMGTNDLLNVDIVQLERLQNNGNVFDFNLTGGAAFEVLTTDGFGNIIWAEPTVQVNLPITGSGTALSPLDINYATIANDGSVRLADPTVLTGADTQGATTPEWVEAYVNANGSNGGYLIATEDLNPINSGSIAASPYVTGFANAPNYIYEVDMSGGEVFVVTPDATHGAGNGYVNYNPSVIPSIGLGGFAPQPGVGFFASGGNIYEIYDYPFVQNKGPILAAGGASAVTMGLGSGVNGGAGGVKRLQIFTPL